MESQLLSLQLEQKKLQAELDKVPESGHRTMVQRRRREELERDLKLIGGSVSGIRNKLRDLDALHR